MKLPYEKHVEFNDYLTSQVRLLVENGYNCFAEIVDELPGYYPEIIRSELKKRTYSRETNSRINKILANIAQQHKSQLVCDINSNHIPHPLDFDWRFTESSKQKLRAYIGKDATTVLCIGCPSFYEHLIQTDPNADATYHLIDKNADRHFAIKSTNQRLCIQSINIERASLGHIKADIVFIDPPWYEYHLEQFIKAASICLKLSKTVVLVGPPLGTRKSIPDEYNSLVNIAHSSGCELCSVKTNEISYDMPLFEKNSLRSIGIRNVKRSWRKGDLLIFTKKKHTENIRLLQGQNDDRVDEVYRFDKIEVRLNEALKTDIHKKLHLFGKHGILKDVSSKLVERTKANLVTSGGRFMYTHDTKWAKSFLKKAQKNLSEKGTFENVLFACEEERNLCKLIQEEIQEATDYYTTR